MTTDEWLKFKDDMQLKMARLTPWVRKTFGTQGAIDAIRNSWWELFEKIPLANAERALKVFHGDPGLHEKVSAGDIPAHIAKLAYTFADRASPRGVARCPHCLDDGLTLVWAAGARRLAACNKLTTKTPYMACAVVCDCPAGQRISGEQHTRFDEKMMFRLESFDVEVTRGGRQVEERVLPNTNEPEQLKRFMALVGSTTTAERCDAFDQFS